jgi:hypothetical protein
VEKKKKPSSKAKIPKITAVVVVSSGSSLSKVIDRCLKQLSSQGRGDDTDAKKIVSSDGAAPAAKRAKVDLAEKDAKSTSVEILGLGNAIPKAVTVAEVVKRTIVKAGGEISQENSTGWKKKIVKQGNRGEDSARGDQKDQVFLLMKLVCKGGAPPGLTAAANDEAEDHQPDPTRKTKYTVITDKRVVVVNPAREVDLTALQS